ncbi:hypothetical protein HK101_005660, partial [Irineochytrium annulatum]
MADFGDAEYHAPATQNRRGSGASAASSSAASKPRQARQDFEGAGDVPGGTLALERPELPLAAGDASPTEVLASVGGRRGSVGFGRRGSVEARRGSFGRVVIEEEEGRKGRRPATISTSRPVGKIGGASSAAQVTSPSSALEKMATAFENVLENAIENPWSLVPTWLKGKDGRAEG